MARKRKPGRPKGSKNRKGRQSKRYAHLTAAQLRALKKAWAARAGKKVKKSRKGKRPKSAKGKATAKQLANLAYARAVRADRKMPKTKLYVSSASRLRAAGVDEMARTVRGPHIVLMPERHLHPGAPSILRRVRRHMPTLVSAT